MYRGLYFKIILILVVFILIVMSVVGAVLISSVLNFYNNEFLNSMDENFSEDGQLTLYLKEALEEEGTGFAAAQKSILSSYASRLGIDDYRSYHILDSEGNFLAGSDSKDTELAMTPNMLEAIEGGVGREKEQGLDYADFALPLSSGDNSCIIYIRDTQEELQQVTWMLFSIILQELTFLTCVDSSRRKERLRSLRQAVITCL